MSIQAPIDTSVNQLLLAVGQLSNSEFDQFVAEVLALRAKRHTPNLPKREMELLQKIYQGIPSDIHKQYEELTEKRCTGRIQLGNEEYNQLLRRRFIR